jgi:hypothetical protein
MKNSPKVPKSPLFPAGTLWSTEKRPGLYESELTAMIRHMLEDEAIREDQRFAWQRWRSGDGTDGKR